MLLREEVTTRAYFYVFQNAMYDIEARGGYLWSPQLDASGKKNAGYTNMTKINKGGYYLPFL